MAIDRLSMKVGKAGKAGPHAAYIAREGEFAERLERGEKLEATATGNMPKWAHAEPQLFWKAADDHERKNGTTYREMEIALPRELSPEQRLALVRDWVQQEIGTKHAYQWAIHNSKAADGGEQPHVHLMFSERQVDGIDRDPGEYFKRANAKHPERGGAKKGYGPHAGEKLTAAERAADLKDLRQRWEGMCNKHLCDAGSEARIDMRSHKERKSGLVPEPKQIPSQWRGRGREEVLGMRADRVEHQGATRELRSTIPDLQAEISARLALAKQTGEAERGASKIIVTPHQEPQNERRIYDPKRDPFAAFRPPAGYDVRRVSSGDLAEYNRGRAENLVQGDAPRAGRDALSVRRPIDRSPTASPVAQPDKIIEQANAAREALIERWRAGGKEVETDITLMKAYGKFDAKDAASAQKNLDYYAQLNAHLDKPKPEPKRTPTPLGELIKPAEPPQPAPVPKVDTPKGTIEGMEAAGLAEQEATRLKHREKETRPAADRHAYTVREVARAREAAQEAPAQAEIDKAKAQAAGHRTETDKLTGEAQAWRDAHRIRVAVGSTGPADELDSKAKHHQGEAAGWSRRAQELQKQRDDALARVEAAEAAERRAELDLSKAEIGADRDWQRGAVSDSYTSLMRGERQYRRDHPELDAELREKQQAEQAEAAQKAAQRAQDAPQQDPPTQGRGRSL